ncbi:MAG: hypothetical protein ACD_80C00077G0007 [uncultured bacterium (gcode 4)]|uniref:Uncharacterized protein n=1 Tax=uncultured bacterium (gcode 4) TaxID=1234023 RepID=K1XJL1_9BACT|nr:MAG: hypothetical protein ACD_80C00077G0007 [uncultured bacterium (gcode 4)]HBB04618.1 hypothetical protein [Candidatus Gracilibacteria bacterium]
MQQNKIVQKAHCPKCLANVCKGEEIEFLLVLPSGNERTIFLSKTISDYTTRMNVNIPQGTALIIKCPECKKSLHISSDVCYLEKVKIEGDPYPDYTLEFFSPMGKHGTVLKKDGKIVFFAGEHYEQVAFGEQTPNNEVDHEHQMRA